MEKYHSVVQKILNLLKENNCWFETFEHEEVRTSEEAARTRPEYTIQQGAKAIVAKVKKKEGEEFIMLVLPGDARFDSKKVKQLLGARDVTFASVEEVAQVTGGVQVGGVPPFGNLFNLKAIVDPSLFNNEKIVFNAGDRKFSVGMKAEDYKKIVSPIVAQIIK